MLLSRSTRSRIKSAVASIRLATLEEDFQADLPLTDPLFKKKTNILPEDYFDAALEILVKAGIQNREQASQADLQADIALLDSFIGRMPNAVLGLMLQLMKQYFQEQLEEAPTTQTTFEPFNYSQYLRSAENIKRQFENVGRLPKLYVEKVRELLQSYEQQGISDEEKEYLGKLELANRAAVRKANPLDLPAIVERIVAGIKHNFSEFKKRQSGVDSFVEEMQTASEIEQAHQKRQEDKKILDVLVKFFVHRAFKTPEVVQQMKELVRPLSKEAEQKLLAECNALVGPLRAKTPGVEVDQLLKIYKKYADDSSLLRMKTNTAKLKILLKK